MRRRPGNHDREMRFGRYGREYRSPADRPRGHGAGMRGDGRGSYDRPFRAPAFYDAEMRRGPYDRRPDGPDATGWSPFAFSAFGWDPVLGWAGWGGGTGFVPGADAPPPMRPERSPAWGRGGDRALREWAAANGYDVEYTIRPRPAPRRANPYREDR
jgi:hypothetical protein